MIIPAKVRIKIQIRLPSEVQISPKLFDMAIKAHKRPYPAMEGLRALKECKPELTGWRAAGTDSSDGLLEAVRNLCESSGCQAVLNPCNLPKDPKWTLNNNWDDWCMNGGEDFELVISLPKKWAKNYLNYLSSGKIIGSIQEGPPKVVWNNGKEIKKERFSNFNHF